MVRRLTGLVLALILGAPLVPAVARPLGGCAAGVHHAALALRHGNGTARTYCLSFDQDRRTGAQLLDIARAQYGVSYSVRTYSFGDFLCALDGEPDHYQSCPPAGSSDPYWAFFVSRKDGPWALSSMGISAQAFGDGDAAGFAYGSPPSTPPSPVGVCPRAVSPGSAQPAQAGGTPPSLSQPAPAAPARAPAGTPVVAGPQGGAPVTTSGSAAAPAGIPSASGGAPSPASGGVAAASTGPPSSPGGAGLRAVPLSSTPPRAGVSPGLLVLCIAAGGLLGLAVLQLTGRRR